MPFVSRDPERRITAIYDQRRDDAVEYLPADSPEVIAFVKGEAAPDPQLSLLESDLAMARVVEDLIEVLVRKNLIMLTDLPQAAQEKLMLRRNLRGDLDGLADLVTEGPKVNLVADL